MKITKKLLKDLRERYKEIPDPVCRICGETMGIVAAGGGPTIYACTGRAGDGWMPGRITADEHYSQSRTSVYGHGDSKVMALLDAYEELAFRMKGLEK